MQLRYGRDREERLPRSLCIGLRAQRDSRGKRRPVHDKEIPLIGYTSTRYRPCRGVVCTGTNTLPLDSPVEVEAIITVKPA